jgi:hypothetical protein
MDARLDNVKFLASAAALSSVVGLITWAARGKSDPLRGEIGLGVGGGLMTGFLVAGGMGMAASGSRSGGTDQERAAGARRFFVGALVLGTVLITAGSVTEQTLSQCGMLQGASKDDRKAAKVVAVGQIAMGTVILMYGLGALFGDAGGRDRVRALASRMLRGGAILGG